MEEKFSKLSSQCMGYRNRYRKTVPITLHMKVSIQKYENYRHIAFLQHVSKILLRTRNERLRPNLKSQIPQEQKKFIMGREKRDPIEYLRN